MNEMDKEKTIDQQKNIVLFEHALYCMQFLHTDIYEKLEEIEAKDNINFKDISSFMYKLRSGAIIGRLLIKYLSTHEVPEEHVEAFNQLRYEIETTYPNLLKYGHDALLSIAFPKTSISDEYPDSFMDKIKDFMNGK